MDDSEEKELLNKVRDIHEYLGENTSKGHTFIIIALIILLAKSCGAH